MDRAPDLTLTGVQTGGPFDLRVASQLKCLLGSPTSVAKVDTLDVSGTLASGDFLPS